MTAIAYYRAIGIECVNGRVPDITHDDLVKSLEAGNYTESVLRLECLCRTFPDDTRMKIMLSVAESLQRPQLDAPLEVLTEFLNKKEKPCRIDSVLLGWFFKDGIQTCVDHLWDHIGVNGDHVVALAKRMVAMFPRNIACYELMASAEAITHGVASAEAYFLLAYNAGSKNHAVLLNVAVSHVKLGDNNFAIGLLREVLATNPNDEHAKAAKELLELL